MTESIADNKRIAKNTLLLYFRMLLNMVISLYTSRVVLNTLGIEDYGIYNVVGGIVTMFVFINSAMTSSTQRYITYAIGKDNYELLRRTFSSALQIHMAISFIIVILAETVGLWFFYEKMIIPESRMSAALWVYQCSIIACVVSVMSVPYNADIIAHEKMSAFAYISILEVILKLIIVFLLLLFPYDRLIVYAILVLCIQIFIRIFYAQYCNKHFEESKYYHVIDKVLLKEMSGFAGWSFLGSFAVVCCNQGQNLLLNIFFGPVVNAARGITATIQAAVNNFSSNFQTAINPQIIKTYALGQIEEHHRLIYLACKFSACLLMILSLPIFLETEEILKLWLGNVPEHTVNFIRIILIISIWDSTAYPLATSIQAVGKIKKYQLTVSSVIILVLPLSYIILNHTPIPELALIVHLCIAIIAQIVRLCFLQNYINLNILFFLKKVYTPIFCSLIISLSISFILFNGFDSGILKLILVTLFSISLGITSSYMFVLDFKERMFVNNAIQKIVFKIIDKK